jgi:hypothetical protein
MSKDDKKKEPTDIVKHEPTNLVDNFEGWEDSVEGDDRPQGGGIIQGTKIKFSNEAKWLQGDDEEMRPGLELIAVDLIRLVQMWGLDGPVNDETIILKPHQMFPDVEQMNSEVPRSKWVEGPDGKMRGPYQASHVLYLLDPQSMDKYTYPTSTVGGRIAIRELRDKIQWLRRMRGPDVYPVILLSDTFMKTRFGGRQRPHFKIVRWVRFGGDDSRLVEAVPGPAPLSPAATAANKPTEQTTARSELPLKTVTEPSLKEEMGDEIPFNDPTPDLGKAESPKVSAPPLPTPRRNLKKPAKASTRKPTTKRRSVNPLEAG